MSIKITNKMLSIPPYISTNWPHIAALHMKEGVLVATLLDGDTIHIPNQTPETIDLVFEHHAIYLEKEQISSVNPDFSKIKDLIDQEEPSFRLAFGSSMDGLNPMIQHNATQSNAPNLPPEVLQKISAIANILAPGEEMILPKAESGCNCFHCQIARAITPDSDSGPLNTAAIPEEINIADEELNFQQWTISQTGDQLYSVINRLDDHEKYNVYLGAPVGCTCGKQGCEHILAVLKS